MHLHWGCAGGDQTVFVPIRVLTIQGDFNPVRFLWSAPQNGHRRSPPFEAIHTRWMLSGRNPSSAAVAQESQVPWFTAAMTRPPRPDWSPPTGYERVVKPDPDWLIVAEIGLVES